MEYTWKHGIQIVSVQTFKTEDPLEVGKILVDLCTGDKYKILSVAKPRDRTRLPVLQTWPGDRSTTQRRWVHLHRRMQTIHGRSMGAHGVLRDRIRAL
jgi:hypothetical protein